MSVIVKGMEMPADGTKYRVVEDPEGRKLLVEDDRLFERGFPLRPLPEKHGRLVDVDAIIAELKDGDSESGVKASGADLVVAILLAYLDSKPTIVEAEGD